MEKTFVLIKPDGVQRALIGKIIGRIEDTGLKVVAMKMLKPDRKLANRHYADDKEYIESIGNKSIAAYEAKGIKMSGSAFEIGSRIRGYLIDYLVSGPVVAIVIEGNEAVSIVRRLAGATAPSKADPSTIRGTYASDSYELSDSQKRPIRNILHVSDAPETAKKEIAMWFSNSEMNEYKRADESAMF